MGKERVSRNRELAKGVNALGRSAMSSKNGRYLHSKKGAKGKKEEKKEEVSAPQSRWYTADDVKRPIASRKANHRATKLRANITPGTVLILLAGQFRGKRVVFLKQLESGLLLVTGPYKINGVNLRRVNQVYVISTSTKIDTSKVDVSSVTDAFFKKAAKKSGKKGSEEFFEEEKEKKEVPQEKKDMQVKVDAAVLKAVAAVPQLKQYLNAKFTAS